MNILKLQDDLKNFSQQQLVMEMQRPSGNVPQFLVLSELSRRKRMRAEQDRAEAADTPTVAQETVAAAGMPMGGATQMARAMAPNTSMTENTGIATMMPKQPTRMAEGGTPQYKNRYEQLMAYLFGGDGDEEKEKPREGTSLAEMINFGGDYEPVKKAEGGVVKMQPGGRLGGTMTAIAQLKVNNPRLYEMYKDDPALPQIALAALEVAEDSKSTGLEQMETPRTGLEKLMDFTKYSPLKARKNMEKIESTAAERELQAQQEAIRALRAKPDLVEGTPADPLTGTFKFPRTLDQVGSPTIEAPNMASDISSSLSPTQPNPEVTLGSMLPPEISMSQPSVPQGLDVPQGNVGVGGKAKEDIIKSLLAGENPFETGVPLELQADAAADLNKRAREFYNTNTYMPPEMIYSGDPREIAKMQGASDEEIQSISDLLAKQAAADEAAKEQGFFTEQDDAAQSVFDEAIAAQEAMLEAENEPKTASDKIIKAFQDQYKRIKNNKASKAFDAEDVAVGSEPPDFEKIAEETKKKQAKDRQEAIETSAQNILDQIQTSQDATQKQASAADMSLSEYIKGLDKDRESSKWLAVARMGAELMKPSATIGEGIGKAISVGAKDLQEGKKAYNKSKLTVLGLQARIDAAKAKSGALTTNQRFTQGLKFAEEARKLKEAAMLSNPPNLDQLGQAEAYEQVAASLLGMPSTSGSTVKAPSAR